MLSTDKALLVSDLWLILSANMDIFCGRYGLACKYGRGRYVLWPMSMSFLLVGVIYGTV